MATIGRTLRQAGVAASLAAALLSGCATDDNKIESDPWLDASRYHRIGVLPFTDPLKHGRGIAEKVVQGLGLINVNSVDMTLLEDTFTKLNLDRSGALSLNSLVEVRQATLADAILFGAVHSDSSGKPRWKGLSLILLDAQTGDVLVEANLRAPAGGWRKNEDVADTVLKILAGPLAKKGPLAPRRAPAQAELPLPD